MAGKIYVVATPIGNLNDLTPRMKQAFEEADFIAAEDTRVSVKLLKDNGKLCVCQRPSQLAAVIYAMKSNRIEPKVIRFVRQRKDSPHPWLVLVDGRKNGGVSLTVMPDLIMENEQGGFSDEVLKIYNKI